jgi:TetR/AcrR family transcriptional repressor of nem operon
MARPREFDTDKAIEDAMHVFWTHGYEEASLPRLLDGMSLTRGSFYKAFESKQAVFLKALACYESLAVETAVQLLSDASIPDPFDRIETALRSIPEAVRQGDQRGCLMCTAAAGPAFDTPEIASAVHKLLEDMTNGFAAALASIPNMADRTHAQMLMSSYTGLRILARAGVAADSLDDSISSLMHLLRQSR